MGFLLAGVDLFRICGVPVRVHWSVLVPLTLTAWAGWRVGSLGEASLAIGLLYLCLFAHETAHVIVARRLKCRVLVIHVTALGMMARLETVLAGRREILIAAAGPATSLSLAGLAALCCWSLRGIDTAWADDTRVGLGAAVVLNVIVGGFNLLPLLPLDGGRILRSTLGLCLRDRVEAPFGTATHVAVRYVTAPLATVGGTVTFWFGWWGLTALAAAIVVMGEMELRALRSSPDPLSPPPDFSLPAFLLRPLSSYLRENPLSDKDETDVLSVQLRMVRFRFPPGHEVGDDE